MVCVVSKFNKFKIEHKKISAKLVNRKIIKIN